MGNKNSRGASESDPKKYVNSEFMQRRKKGEHEMLVKQTLQRLKEAPKADVVIFDLKPDKQNLNPLFSANQIVQISLPAPDAGIQQNAINVDEIETIKFTKLGSTMTIEFGDSTGQLVGPAPLGLGTIDIGIHQRQTRHYDQDGNMVGIHSMKNAIDLKFTNLPKPGLDQHEYYFKIMPGQSNGESPRYWLPQIKKLMEWQGKVKNAKIHEFKKARDSRALPKKTEEPKVEEEKVAEPIPIENKPKQPTAEELRRAKNKKDAEQRTREKQLAKERQMEMASRIANAAMKKEKELRDAGAVVPDPQDAKADEVTDLRRLAANDSMDNVFSMLWILPLLVIFVFWFKRYIVTRKNNDDKDIVQDNVNEDENSLNNIV